MAFNSFLRRASASILPLEIGSAGRVIVNVEKVGKQFLPFSRFLTTGSADDLLAAIESDCAAQRSSNNVKPAVCRPDGFPFEIEHFGSRLSFKWMYQDERIRVYVDSLRKIFNDPPRLRMKAYVKRRNLDMVFEMDVVDNKLSVNHVFVSSLDHVKGFEEYYQVRGIEPSLIKAFV